MSVFGQYPVDVESGPWVIYDWGVTRIHGDNSMEFAYGPHYYFGGYEPCLSSTFPWFVGGNGDGYCDSINGHGESAYPDVDMYSDHWWDDPNNQYVAKMPTSGSSAYGVLPNKDYPILAHLLSSSVKAFKWMDGDLYEAGDDKVISRLESLPFIGGSTQNVCTSIDEGDSRANIIWYCTSGSGYMVYDNDGLPPQRTGLVLYGIALQDNPKTKPPVFAGQVLYSCIMPQVDIPPLSTVQLVHLGDLLMAIVTTRIDGVYYWLLGDKTDDIPPGYDLYGNAVLPTQIDGDPPHNTGFEIYDNTHPYQSEF